MTSDEKLISIIKHKGNCTGISCGVYTGDICPLAVKELCRLEKETDRDKVRKNKYKYAIELFFETHTKEDLVEVLL